MRGFSVTMTDSVGEQWALTDGAPGRSGVWLMGPPDLQSKVIAGVRSTTRQIGGRATGWAIDPMVGTLKLGLWDEVGAGHLPVWSPLMRGLSMFDDCELTVVTPGHGDAVTRFRVDGALPMPDRSPANRDSPAFEVSVPVVSYEGCWSGDRVVSTAPVTTWENLGDLPARGLVRWSGPGASVRIRERGSAFDTGVVSLPTAPAGKQAELDLDPAVASRVQVDGVDHPGLWRAMRARFFPEIMPGHEVEVILTGVAEVDLAARMTSPWRWS